MPFPVFISYAHSDRKLCQQLEKHLSNLKQQNVITSWYDGDISPGTEWKSQILDHLNRAQIILLLISVDFMASDFCYSIEMKQALARHDANQARVIPIILRPTDWQDAPFAKLKVLPTGGKAVTRWPTLDDAFEDTVQGIRRAITDLEDKQPSVSSERVPHTANSIRASEGHSPIWNVPLQRNPFFTGREALLTRLHDQFHTTKTSALTRVQAISGLGGIGKTQIAVEYTYRYQDEYEAVLWVGAETRLSLFTNFVKLAAVLQLPTKDTQDQEQVAVAVKHWLETHTGWLLILDGADDVRMATEILPMGGKGHILLTTRDQAVVTIPNRIEIEKLDKQEGTLLLLRRSRLISDDDLIEAVEKSRRSAAEAIVQAVDGLPLALDQAGTFIEETGCGLAGYLNLYHTHRKDLLQRRSSLPTDHPEAVANTWSLSFQMIEQTNRAAAALLRLCAFLAPDAIPEEILTEGAPDLGNVLGSVTADPLKFNMAISVLLRYSLLKRDVDTKTFSIHRLVQTMLRDEMGPKAQRQWAERAVRAVNRVFPDPKMETWAQCERYLPHVQVCAELIAHYQLHFPEAARLLDRAGDYLQDHTRYNEAESL